MSHDGFLGRALMDPATGLPNVPYFRLIRDWEERRARRRKYSVRVLRVMVQGGDDRARRALGWRLCREVRDSDLIASQGSGHFRILLTSPDAENAELICARIRELGVALSARHRAGAEPLTMHVTVDGDHHHRESGPCDPCDHAATSDSGEGPEYGG